MPRVFFINRAGTVEGPIRASQLRMMADTGQLNRDDQIGVSADGPWARAERAKGLFASEPESITRSTEANATGDGDRAGASTPTEASLRDWAPSHPAILPSPSLPPASPSLRLAGALVSLLGIIITFIGIQTDPEVEMPGLSSDDRQELHSIGMTSRVNNIGLLSNRQTLVLSGTMVWCTGVAVITAGEVVARLRPKATSGEVPMPPQAKRP